MHRILIAALCVIFAAPQLQAQSADTEVRAVIDSLFDAIRVPNGEVAARLFHPEARLHSVVDDGAGYTLQSAPIAAFVDAIGSPRTEVWDERIRDVEIRVDGGLATAWMQYAFQVDGVISHCGVNAFQVVRSAGRWQILQVTDTRRQTECVAGS